MRLISQIVFFAWACCVPGFAAPAVTAAWDLTADVRCQPGFRAQAFSAKIADNYGGNWLALQIPLANGLAYEELPGMLTIRLRASLDSAFEVYSELPLRRDLEAWHHDELGSSVFYKPSELDINMPIVGWAAWKNAYGFVQAGRFKPDLGPSPNTVVLGPAAPYHDAAWWHLAFRHIQFDWVLSSLNATLTGTPATAGGTPSEGSEAWQQLHYMGLNQRNRIYAEPEKNLLVHRLAYQGNWGWLAVIEQQMVGGKSLSFRDMNPFMAWHDNYSDGYTKASTTAELGLTPSSHGKFYWQIDFEDISSPVGETEGETSPTTLGTLVGWRQDWRSDSLWSLWTRFDAVYTDPSFNNYRIPLLKMTSRRLYRSNYREQGATDENNNDAFADTYIVDYPLGYRRGPDAVDLWFNLGFESHPRHMGGELEFAWLQQGDKELWTLWDTASQYNKALSGIVEREQRLSLSGWWQPSFVRTSYSDWTLRGCLGIRRIENEAHERGKDRWEPLWSLGVSARVGS